jgi:hypothetical protein
MFDLQMTQVQHGFASRQQADSRALRRESDRQTFSNAAARAGDQDGNPF